MFPIFNLGSRRKADRKVSSADGESERQSEASQQFVERRQKAVEQVSTVASGGASHLEASQQSNQCRQSVEERLQATLNRIEELLRRGACNTPVTSVDLYKAFSATSRPEDCIAVTNELLQTCSDRSSICIEKCELLSSNSSFDLFPVLKDSYRADVNELDPDRFPLNSMEWKHTRAFLSYAASDTPWLLVDVCIDQKSLALNTERQAHITLYSSQQGTAGKAAEWVGAKLNLAKKRPDSPLRKTNLNLKGMQDIVLPSIAELGPLGASITAALISRHDSLDPLKEDARTMGNSLRLACAQDLEQRLAQRSGDVWSVMEFGIRIKSLLRGAQDGVEDNPIVATREPVAQTKHVSSKLTSVVRTPWTSAEEQTLIQLRSNGNSWDEAAVVLKRNTASLKKRFYKLPDNGSEGRKRIRVAGQQLLPDDTEELLGSSTVEQPFEGGDSDGESETGEGEQPLVAARKTLPLLPLEKTGQVPCINADRGCNEVFATYLAAHHHDSKYCSQKQKKGPFVCRWPGCNKQFATTEGRANHQGGHTDDPSARFVCRRGCGRRWPTEHLLTTHEMNCGRDKRPKGTKRTKRILEYNLEPNNNNSEPASVLIVGRNSGGTVPLAWFAGKDSLENGVPLWAQDHVDDYRRLYNDNRPAKVIVGVRVRSIYVPSPPAAGFVLGSDKDSVKADKRRAIKHTTAIEESMRVAPDKPVIVSIGADGFSCATGLIKSFLDRNKPFRLVVRHHCIEQSSGSSTLRLTESELKKDGGKVWWRAYESEDIRLRLSNLPYQDKRAVDELVAWWNRLQAGKDGISDYKLIPGRNNAQKPTAA